jgi:surface polysaccharide O-acyltransferase-like enzyme
MDGNVPPQTLVRRIDYLDLLKCYALILVLVVHVSASGSYLWGAASAKNWWIATAFGSFARTCVPLFLMASGATLVEPVGLFMARRARRIVVPLLIWSVVYQLDRFGPALTFNSVLRDLLLGTSFYHLAFFYYLFGLYLCAPVLARFADGASPGSATYFAGLWLLMSCQALISDLTGDAVGVPVPVVMGFAGYFVMGRILRDVAIGKHAARLCVITTLAVTLVTLVGTFMLTRKAGNLDQMLFEYGRPNIVVMSVCTFLVLSSAPLRQWLGRRQQVLEALRTGSGFVFGIYLVHPLLLQRVVPAIGINWMTFGVPVGIPLSVIVLLGLSISVVWGLRKVSWLREAVP